MPESIVPAGAGVLLSRLCVPARRAAFLSALRGHPPLPGYNPGCRSREDFWFPLANVDPGLSGHRSWPSWSEAERTKACGFWRVSWTFCTPPTLPAPRSNRLPALKHYHEEARYKLNMLCVGPLSTFTRNEKKGGRIQTNMANGKVIHYFYFLPYVNLLEFIQ